MELRKIRHEQVNNNMIQVKGDLPDALQDKLADHRQ